MTSKEEMETVMKKTHSDVRVDTIKTFEWCA